jgi:hypothetical protein
LPTSSSNGPSASQRLKARPSPISSRPIQVRLSRRQLASSRRGDYRRQRLGHFLVQRVPRLSNRRDADRRKGQPPLNIDESIPIETAIDAYTINAAYAMKQDATTGSLEVGKRADLVVLDRDILTIDPETIGETQVLATYLDGRLVYSAQAGSKAEDDGRGAGQRAAQARLRRPCR